MKDEFKFIALVVVIVSAVLGGLLGSKLGGGISDDAFYEKFKMSLDRYMQEQQAAQPPTYVEGDFTDDDAMLGDANAPITMIEFSDFQCSYCAKFYAETYSQIKENYVNTGKVKLIYRDLPLDFHEGAYPAALAAECVRDQGGDELFFAMHDKLFENQEFLYEGREAIDSGLAAFADELGVDMNAYNECYENEKFKEEIQKDIADAESAYITGTPGFLINGYIISGALPYEQFAQAFEQLLTQTIE